MATNRPPLSHSPACQPSTRCLRTRGLLPNGEFSLLRCYRCFLFCFENLFIAHLANSR